MHGDDPPSGSTRSNEAGVPAGRCNTIDEVFADPQVAAPGDGGRRCTHAAFGEHRLVRNL